MLPLGCRVDSGKRLHRFILCSGRSGGTTTENGGCDQSELDLQSVTPLSVAGCGRLPLGVANWATSLALLPVVDN